MKCSLFHTEFLIYRVYKLLQCGKDTEYKYENLLDYSKQNSDMVRRNMKFSIFY